jgi:hypothetical protein
MLTWRLMRFGSPLISRIGREILRPTAASDRRTWKAANGIEKAATACGLLFRMLCSSAAPNAEVAGNFLVRAVQIVAESGAVNALTAAWQAASRSLM